MIVDGGIVVVGSLEYAVDTIGVIVGVGIEMVEVSEMAVEALVDDIASRSCVCPPLASPFGCSLSGLWPKLNSTSSPSTVSIRMVLSLCGTGTTQGALEIVGVGKLVEGGCGGDGM